MDPLWVLKQVSTISTPFDDSMEGSFACKELVKICSWKKLWTILDEKFKTNQNQNRWKNLYIPPEIMECFLDQDKNTLRACMRCYFQASQKGIDHALFNAVRLKKWLDGTVSVHSKSWATSKEKKLNVSPAQLYFFCSLFIFFNKNDRFSS